MNKSFSNPCIRCGTERIITRTWNENIGESIIVNTETACPNVSCQEKVDEDNKKLRDKHIAIQLKKEEKIQERKASMEAKKQQVD